MAPDLELKATYGLVAPEEFSSPPRNVQWTAEVYNAFDITKLPEKQDEKKQDEKQDEVGQIVLVLKYFYYFSKSEY